MTTGFSTPSALIVERERAPAALLRCAIGKCLASAVRAPSGDNMQPWRFEVDADAGRITVFLDETRDPSPMNSGQTMSRIACGAAVENIMIEAEACGFHAELEEFTGTKVASVRLTPSNRDTGEFSLLHAAIFHRTSNRREYDGLQLSNATLEQLRVSTPARNGVSMHWIGERAHIRAVADVVGRGDEIMFGAAPMRNAFLSNIRFDRPPFEEVEEGLSQASLEVSAAERLAMRSLKHIPSPVLSATGSFKLFKSHARRLVNSASGLCVVAASDASDHSFFAVGRAVQRAWLTLTAHGFAVQPMMSLLVLANARRRGAPEVIKALGQQRTEELVTDFASLLPGTGAQQPMFLLRFGHAPRPSGRTGRRPV